MMLVFLLLLQQSIQSQDININRSSLKNWDGDIILKQKEVIICQDLGTSWYSGQVLKIDARCRQCGYEVQMNSLVQVNTQPVVRSSGSQIHQISDIFEINNFNFTEFAILSRTEFNVYGAEFGSYTYYFKDQMVCTIMNGNKNKLLFFYCFEEKLNYIINIAYAPGLFTPINQIEIQMMNPTTMISTDQYFFMANSEQVQIYSHTSFGYNLKLVKTLDYKNIEVSLKELTYNPDPKQNIFHFHLVMIDEKNQLKIVGFVMNGDVYTESFIKMVDLKQYLKQEGHQIKDDTQFNGIQVFYENLFDDRLESKYIITTNNVNQFIINFKYSCVANICQEIIEKGVQKELDTYGDWIAQAKLAQIYQNKYVLLPYQNNMKVKGVFTLYDLENASNIINIVGGSNCYLQEQKQFIFYIYQDKLRIIDSMEYSVEYFNTHFYDVNTSPSFCLSGKIQNQGISFDLSNDFTEERTFFEIQIRPDRDPSYIWLWILILVGSTLIVMGGIMIVKSIRKQQHTNLL